MDESFDSVVLQVAGLGFSFALVNGVPSAADEYLTTSAWTRYSKRVAFASHDITNLLKPAGMKNCVGVGVGAGWRASQRTKTRGFFKHQVFLRSEKT